MPTRTHTGVAVIAAAAVIAGGVALLTRTSTPGIVSVPAGQSLPATLRSGVLGKSVIYELAAGVHPAQRRFQSGPLHDIIIQGAPGAKLQGNNGNETIGFSNFQRVTIRDLDISGGRNNIFANRGQGLTIQRVRSHHPSGARSAGICILTGGVDDLLVEDFTGDDSRDHGLYVSERSRRVTLRRLKLRRNQSSALQLNANESQGLPFEITGVLVEDVLIENSKGAGVNLMGVRGTAAVPALFRRVKVHTTDHLGISFYDDGQPGKAWCEHIMVEDSEFLNTSLPALQAHPSARDIRLKNVLVQGRIVDLAGKFASLVNVRRPDGKPVVARPFER